MPEIPCPGGLSTLWKTKSAALKWANKINKWPCGTSNCGKRGLRLDGGRVVHLSAARAARGGT